MKGQSEIVGFVLLFLIGATLFSTAFLWSRDMFQENVDNARLNAAEIFMEKMDESIINAVEYGGVQTIRYTLPYQIGITGGRLEIRGETIADLPAYPVNLRDSQSKSVITEKKEGDILIVQLYYRESNRPDDYTIVLYTDAATISMPETITIEKASTEIIDNIPVIKIQITFK